MGAFPKAGLTEQENLNWGWVRQGNTQGRLHAGCQSPSSSEVGPDAGNEWKTRETQDRIVEFSGSHKVGGSARTNGSEGTGTRSSASL